MKLNGMQSNGSKWTPRTLQNEKYITHHYDQIAVHMDMYHQFDLDTIEYTCW